MLKKVRQIVQQQKLNNNPDDKLAEIQNRIFKQASIAVITIIMGGILAVTATVAWYTNIAETSSLVFEAAAWGLDGDIELVESVIRNVTLGSEGDIYLKVENNNDAMISVTVNISKDEMSEEMQKRMYFYVDAVDSRNGEAMEQSYINKTSGYVYEVFGNDTLKLTDEQCNDDSLKWEWVYDVQGYYVQGTVTSATADIEEYLRPIEYDFDKAEFDEDTGKLLKVDEDMTLSEYLQSLSASDGYQGTIDETTKMVNGYYPIEVDDAGYGTWLYVYDLEEIKASWEYDTELGEVVKDGTAVTSVAQINITAQQVNLEGFEANSITMLRLGLVGDNEVITLTSDITAGSSIEVPENKAVIIDLNNHIISGAEDLVDPIIVVGEGASVTLINGTISSEYSDSSQYKESKDGYAISVVGANVALNNVTLDEVYGGVIISDNTSYKSYDSSVKVKNSTIDAEFIGVKIFGNGLASGELTSLIVENSIINGETYAGILGNGGVDSVSADGVVTNGYWGTDIEIIESEISGFYTAMYQPQKASITDIYDSRLSGFTGIVVKGGTLNITDSYVQGTGTKGIASFASGGFTDTGDALYVENGYGWDIIVNIYGESVLSSVYSYAIQQFDKDSSYAEYANISVYGGSFTSDISKFLASGYSLSGGGTGYYQVSE